MRQSGETFIVTHREYIKDVTSANSGFGVSITPINPGLASSFPWLSQIAARFESYIFDRLDFVYQPICNTTTSGSVMMAVDFDALDVAPADKAILMANQHAVRCSPWDNVRYSSRSKNLHKFGIQRYVRSVAAPDKSDIKTYDVGNFFVASQNTPATTTSLGELYVEYTVRLFTPQIQTSLTTAVKNSNVSQMGTIVVPKVGNDVAAAMKSIIYTDSDRPLMWLGQVMKDYLLVFMNFKDMGPSIVNWASQTLPSDMISPVKLFGYFQNALPGASAGSDYPYKISEMAENVGLAWRQNLNDALRALYIRPNTGQFSDSFKTGEMLKQPNPYPFLIKRSPTTDFTYNFSVLPFPGSVDIYPFSSGAKIALDYAYNEVLIPTLTPGFQPTKSIKFDNLNDFEVRRNLDDFPELEEINCSTSRLNLFSRFK